MGRAWVKLILILSIKEKKEILTHFNLLRLSTDYLDLPSLSTEYMACEGQPPTPPFNSEAPADDLSKCKLDVQLANITKLELNLWSEFLVITWIVPVTFCFIRYQKLTKSTRSKSTGRFNSSTIGLKVTVSILYLRGTEMRINIEKQIDTRWDEDQHRHLRITMRNGNEDFRFLMQ